MRCGVQGIDALTQGAVRVGRERAVVAQNYCGNNPVNRVDPLGLRDMGEILGKGTKEWEEAAWYEKGLAAAVSVPLWFGENLFGLNPPGTMPASPPAPAAAPRSTPQATSPIPGLGGVAKPGSGAYAPQEHERTPENESAVRAITATVNYGLELIAEAGRYYMSAQFWISAYMLHQGWIGIADFLFGAFGYSPYVRAPMRVLAADPISLPGPGVAWVAKRIVSRPGYQDVIVHGTRETVAIKVKGEWKHLSAEQLATRIREGGAWEGGNIRLVSCSTGTIPKGLACELAAELGVKVLAPDGVIVVHPQGGMTIHTAWWFRGELKWVNPRPKQGDNWCEFGE